MCCASMGKTFPKVAVRPNIRKKRGATVTRQGKGAQTPCTPPPRSWPVLIYLEPPSSMFPFPSSLPSKDKIQTIANCFRTHTRFSPQPPKPFRKSSSTPVIRLKQIFSFFFVVKVRSVCVAVSAVALSTDSSAAKPCSHPQKLRRQDSLHRPNSFRAIGPPLKNFPVLIEGKKAEETSTIGGKIRS